MTRVIMKENCGHEERRLEAGEEGPGGAPTSYTIHHTGGITQLTFPGGVETNAKLYGVTNELLLEVLIDRLANFQAGPCPSPHNEKALNLLNDALHELEARADDRTARGVQGTMEP